MNDTSIKMYILVNQDLNMGKGKIAGQVGHGVAMMVRFMEKLKECQKPRQHVSESMNTYQSWANGLECKVILKASGQQMKDLSDKYNIFDNGVNKVFAVPVYDAGKTQIPSGSFTTLTFCPLYDSDVPLQLKTMKLL
jgi:PTH2 family peptidyl-tRNA hydrolase